jgi:hypothetical protein
MDAWEKQHLRNLQQKEKEIRKLYENSIHEITVTFSQVTWNGETFYLKDYPRLLQKINAQIKKLHASIYTATVNGIQDSWDLSNEKNNIFVDKRLAGKQASKAALQILFDPNLEALEAFISRKTKGLNLSDRVWNALDGYRTEMEAVIGVAVNEGKSANELANGLKRFLNEPDRLFRRVRTDDGKLKLSRAAKNYHPGQGVYRSSFMNAKRIATTETNAAYRNADIERWRTLPFVKAYKINLSNNHPEYDICDVLAGVYPLWFNWTAWHPNCRCYLTAEQISNSEYDKMEDQILKTGKAPQIEKLDEMPEKFNEYVEQNAERIKGWAALPYWLKFNPKLSKELL